ncbi:MAG TPA: hypothetical protein VN541_25040, partial [Tepidisphaeraceae bacterium]|nr:hypothetical protein [Tepidisphaeraceae bacterium]
MALPDNSVTSGADGRFRITGLGAERTAMIQFSSPSVSAERIRVVTRQMKPVNRRIGLRDTFIVYGADFEITAGPARSVRGTIRDAKTHQPLAGVAVRTWGNSSMQTVTDSWGSFRFDGLPKKDGVTIETLPYDRAPYFTGEVQVPNSPGAQPVDVNIDLQPGLWVTGKITDQETGQPVPAQVEYIPFLSNRNGSRVFPSNMGLSQSPGNCYTKVDGTYRVAALPGVGVIGVLSHDPRYRKGAGEDRITERNPQGRIKAYSPGNMPGLFNAVKEVIIAEGAAGATADVQLDPGGAILLTFTDPTGKPIGNLDVCDKTGNNAYSTHIDQPTLLITGISPSEKRVIVATDRQQKFGKVVVVSLKDIPDRKLKVQLEPMAVVTGRLVNPDGEPVNTGLLRPTTRFVELRNNNKFLWGTRSGPNGRFTLPLAAGCHYFLEASYNTFGGRFAEIKDDLTVRPGETK